MIKSIVLIKKKCGLTDEEFYRYWKEEHGPLAAKVVPGLRKYVQNHPIHLPNLEYEMDGVVEFWFDNLEASQKYLDWRKSGASKVLLDDEDKFIDRNRYFRYIVEEHVIM